MRHEKRHTRVRSVCVCVCCAARAGWLRLIEGRRSNHLRGSYLIEMVSARTALCYDLFIVPLLRGTIQTNGRSRRERRAGARALGVFGVCIVFASMRMRVVFPRRRIVASAPRRGNLRICPPLSHALELHDSHNVLGRLGYKRDAGAGGATQLAGAGARPVDLSPTARR
ncbi:hypothetical protein EVAR_29347_1 [Eumeta japonica]|uniref:Uncharacterized protein n=1 Tax=Eumeta variegata TaxID=151549 RepID=A0A4C1WGS6_EUMVA|nr:hypothetical protein EVAR_29347_1 [Eumeta japonica]